MIPADWEWDFLMFAPGKLFTTNGERQMYRYRRSELVRYWREKLAAVAKEMALPHFDHPIDIIVAPVQKLGRLGDASGHAPAAKAAIDGLRDAGVLDDDDGRYVRSITYLAPQRGPTEGLCLALVEVESD